MATIEELERKARQIRLAEADAIRRLVDEMREAAVQLPDGSGLALRLVETANRLEAFARPRDAGNWGGSVLRSFGVEYEREHEDELEDED